MPKRVEEQSDQRMDSSLPPVASVLPDADEEHASLALVNKWVGLADAALKQQQKSRKRA